MTLPTSPLLRAVQLARLFVRSGQEVRVAVLRAADAYDLSPRVVMAALDELNEEDPLWPIKK